MMKTTTRNCLLAFLVALAIVGFQLKEEAKLNDMVPLPPLSPPAVVTTATARIAANNNSSHIHSSNLNCDCNNISITCLTSSIETNNQCPLAVEEEDADTEDVSKQLRDLSKALDCHLQEEYAAAKRRHTRRRGRVRLRHRRQDHDLDDSAAPTKKKRVNFFSCAVGNHENFLPLYAFFALSSSSASSTNSTTTTSTTPNDDATVAAVPTAVPTPPAIVEMVVENRIEFIQRNARSLSWLLTNFGKDSICVREYSDDPQIVHQRTKQKYNIVQQRMKVVWKNTWRYFEIPVRKAHYTYIGDVDLLLTEDPSVDPYRLQQMEYFQLPYSNIVRRNSTRLTGLMLIETDQFYNTPELLKAQRTVDPISGDEEVWYNIVKQSGIGLPTINPSSSTTTTNTNGNTTTTTTSSNNNIDNNKLDLFLQWYRPEHGLHLSLNRGPTTKMCIVDWGYYGKSLRDTPRHVPSGQESWCQILSTPRLREYLCNDPRGYEIFKDRMEVAQQQVNSNMTGRPKGYTQCQDTARKAKA